MDDWISALINMGSNYLAGEAAEDRNNAMINAQENANFRNLEFAREQGAKNEALQREFASMGVRWRVEDAKAAGVHPLYALGAGGAAFANNPIVMPFQASGAEGRPQGMDWRAAGQSLSRAISAQETADQRAMRDATLGNLAAQTAENYAQASYWDAMAAKTRGDRISTSPFPASGGNSGDAVTIPWSASEDPKYEDWISLKASEIDTHARGDQGVLAGRNPMSQRFYMDREGRHELVLPSNRVAEAWEDMPIMAQLGYLVRNLPMLMRMGSERMGDAVMGSAESAWKRRHGVDQDAIWTGSGAPPWSNQNRARGKIRYQ